MGKPFISFILILGALCLPSIAYSQAQPYPNRPVKVIVAFIAGGTTDILTRMVSQKLSDRIKQSFVVENKPGEAFNWMHRLELACRSQLAAMACYTAFSTVPEDIIEATYQNYQLRVRRPYG